MRIKFGTDGWRAIMAEEFTFDNLKLVVQAICNYYLKSQHKDRPLIVGHDTRFFAEEFAKSVLGVLAGNRIKAVTFSRPMPTPITAFSINKLNAGGAFMLTASHNPPGYNGLKFIPDYAGPAFPEITKKIEEEIAKLEKGGDILYKPNGDKLAQLYDPLTDYHKAISQLVDFNKFRNSNIKVGIDPLYGTAQGILSSLLQDAGAEVYSIHENRDVLFGGGLPDPSEERLAELVELVREKNLDLGLALDGDADRFAAVDKKGTYYAANQIVPMIMRYLIEEKKMTGKAVRTVATTHLIDAVAKAYNIPIVEVPVGFKYICREMLNGDILIGGEESGGMSIKGHIPEKDGIIAGLLLAEIVTQYNISDYLKKMYQDFGYFKNTRIDLEMDINQKKRLLNQLKENSPTEIINQKVKNKVDIDGYKFILENEDWLLARPSGTEPIVRIYIESTNSERFDELHKYALSLTTQA